MYGFGGTMFDVRCTIRNVRFLMYDVRKYSSFSDFSAQILRGLFRTSYIQNRTLSNFLAQILRGLFRTSYIKQRTSS
jgi:hypothetical protein